MDLNLVHIIFELRTDDQFSLMPRLYDAVRRFENYFKMVCCSQKDSECILCKEQSEDCPFRSVFGQHLSTDPDVVRRHQKPSLPFAFKISMSSSDKSCIELSIVVVGNAIRHASVFNESVTLMIACVAENSKLDADVTETWCLDYQGGRHKLNPSSRDLILLSGMDILQGPDNPGAVRINIESPLKLLRGGSIIHSFDFGVLLRSQLRRCSSLFAYYGEGELELDYTHISDVAGRVASLENNFNFTQPQWAQQANLCGILGEGEFTGLADGLLPLLKLGSYFNAGKGAPYGMGVYRIEEG